MVRTSNCINLQKPLGRVNFDEAGVEVHSSANGVGKRDQYLPISFTLNKKEIRPAGSKYVGHLSETPLARCTNLQSHEAENIIGALGEVNQILTLEEDIRAHEGLRQGRGPNPFQLQDHPVAIVLGLLDAKITTAILTPEANNLSRSEWIGCGGGEPGSQQPPGPSQTGAPSYEDPPLVISGLGFHRHGYSRI
jgi:hypothetical protein